jgi:hypothetical protein
MLGDRRDVVDVAATPVGGRSGGRGLNLEEPDEPLLVVRGPVEWIRGGRYGNA